MNAAEVQADQTGTAEEETPESNRREMDAELKTMSLIIRTLDKESPEARSRIVAYISSRYVRE